MTAGHKHRTIRLRSGGTLLHLLRTPLVVHRDEDAAEASRWTWGARTIPAHPGDLGGVEYVLTPLGILHTLTGLIIQTEEPA